jgi:hypothetical protein
VKQHKKLKQEGKGRKKAVKTCFVRLIFKIFLSRVVGPMDLQETLQFVSWMSSEGNKKKQEFWGKGSDYLSSLYEQMSKYFIPTSSQLLHLSQRNLLERFVK